jgi:DnaJ-class molecular chaperone
MTILLTCRRCKGTGQVPNEQYLVCQALESHETRRYFHMKTEDTVSDDELPESDGCKEVPETVECPVCNGAGQIEFDEEEWQLRIIADEEDVV